MRKIFTFVIDHSLSFVGGGFLACGLLTVCLVCIDKQATNFALVGESLERSLSIMMTLESPRSVITGAPVAIRILSWMVGFCGWLMIPLLVSAVISHTSAIELLEREYRLVFTKMGKKMELEGPELDKFVEELIQAKEKAFQKFK